VLPNLGQSTIIFFKQQYETGATCSASEAQSTLSSTVVLYNVKMLFPSIETGMAMNATPETNTWLNLQKSGRVQNVS
jgi:hypothetical protein